MKVGVYGLGRFGQFWVEFLTSQGLEVYTYNRTPRELTTPSIAVDLESLCQLDVVFLCTAISALSQVSAEIAPLLSAETVVMDTCSVKTHPLRELDRHLSKKQAILGTHPMFGPDSVGKEGLPIVLIPWRVAQGVMDHWRTFFTAAGLRVIIMTAEEHDREAARTQGITHFMGRFLAALELHPSSISTVGFQKMFEIMEQTCNDPWQLFVDLQSYNPYTSEIRKRMTSCFNEMIQLLDNGTEVQ